MLKTIQRIVRDAIDDLHIDRQPSSLYEPIEYALACGGKRLRPTLTLLGYGLYHDDVQKALTPAIAFEIYHNYTLLHDDLMDNSSMRRGRPTVHCKWDANTAILSGDAMLTYAVKTMTDSGDSHLRELVSLLLNTALEVCEGQQYDMDFEHRDNVTVQEYMEMIRLKTSVLLAAALKAGAIVADAPEEDQRLLYAFAEKLGLAFQLQDDYLDVYGNPDTFGKRIGGDILCGKKTFMLITALQCLASDNQRLKLLINTKTIGEEEEHRKIEAVTCIYNELGIPQLAQQQINSCFAEAEEYLRQIKVSNERKQPLLEFAHALMQRKQ